MEQLPPEELFSAIRPGGEPQHWSSEADNWLRDTTFREDRVRGKEPECSKTLASIVSVAGNLLRQQKNGFLKAMQEDIACNPSLAISLFKHHNLL